MKFLYQVMNNSWTKEDLIIKELNQVRYGQWFVYLLFKLKILQLALGKPKIYYPGLKLDNLCGVYKVCWYEVEK